jgi:hypothetical protein
MKRPATALAMHAGLATTSAASLRIGIQEDPDSLDPAVRIRN